MLTAQTRFETPDCTLEIGRVRRGRLLIVLSGKDLGELGSAPFERLEAELMRSPSLELFIDLQAASGATLEVSGSWAVWLRKNEARLHKVTMLTGSPFIHLSAKAVKRFSQLGERARLYSDPLKFATELAAAS
jgi:hypothetical protein